MRLFSKSEVVLLLRFQALQKAQNSLDMLLNIGILHLQGEVPAPLGIAGQGKALMEEMDKVRAELLPREAEIKALMEEIQPDENQEEVN